uniref:Uncharacterized protein n=1 Tax=Rhizophora mucronata TaxID=61149 RepID=A0A2P2INJ1_RHIMU
MNMNKRPYRAEIRGNNFSFVHLMVASTLHGTGRDVIVI